MTTPPTTPRRGWARHPVVATIIGVLCAELVVLPIGAIATIAEFSHPVWMMAASAALPLVAVASARIAGARAR